jgi:hypothetical protein
MILRLAAHLHRLADGTAKEKCEAFSRPFFESYGNRLHEKGAEWLSNDRLYGYVRSMWIIHGRELINSTNWEKKCTCKESRCIHNQEAVQKGVEYILAAERNSFDSRHDTFLKPIYSRG